MARTISIRDLHLHTGRWVRDAAASVEGVIVLDRGRPAARLTSLESGGQAASFAGRRLVPKFEDLPRVDADSGAMLEEERR